MRGEIKKAGYKRNGCKLIARISTTIYECFIRLAVYDVKAIYNGLVYVLLPPYQNIRCFSISLSIHI